MYRAGRRSGCRVHRTSLFQIFSSELLTTASKQHSVRKFTAIRDFQFRNAATLSANEVTADDNEVGTSASWTVIQRPLQETLLKSYAQHPTVAQPLILHGPRGVGKRTLVESE
jgi:hypothetical protein